MMLNKFKKLIPAIILIIIISSLGVFILETRPVEAAGLWDILNNPKEAVISLASNATYYLVFRPVSLILSLAGFLLDWAFGLESFTDVNVVQEGWRITRGLTNMFFILILMIIAFATILRVETYGMKALLPKLIIAALLINFSLLFCGAIIDSTQILCHFFLDPLEGSLSARVAEGLNIMKVFEKEPEVPGLDGLNILIGLIFGVIVIVVASITLAAAAFFLIIRVVVLWILIVLAPIAWLMWILPSTRSLFSQWWSAFLKWSFFAPVYGFFFYLAIITIIGKEGETEGFLSRMTSNIPLGKNEGFMDSLFSSQQLLLQYIFLIILLFGGLVAAQKLGVMGASGIINITKNAGKKVGRMSWQGAKIGTATVGKAPGLRKIPKAEDMKRKIMSGAERVPGLGKAIGGPGAYQAKQKEKVEEEKKRLSNRTASDLEIIRNQTVFTKEDKIRKIAAMEELATKGQFKGTYEQNEKDLKMFKQMGGDSSKIIKSRPDLAPIFKDIDPKDVDKVKEEINESVGKIKPKDVDKIQIEAIGKPGEESKGNQKVVLDSFRDQFKVNGKLGKSVLAKAADENPALYNKIMNEVIKPNLKDMKDEVQEYYRSTTGKPLSEEEKKEKEKSEASRIIPASKYGPVK